MTLHQSTAALSAARVITLSRNDRQSAIGLRIPNQRKIAANGRKKLDQLSIIPQRIRLAKLSKSLVAAIVERVIENAADFTLLAVIEHLAVFQQLPAPLQISVSRPAPRSCGQILAIVPGSVNLTLAKY